jgi:hypothetical protein
MKKEKLKVKKGGVNFPPAGVPRLAHLEFLLTPLLFLGSFLFVPPGAEGDVFCFWKQAHRSLPGHEVPGGGAALFLW